MNRSLPEWTRCFVVSAFLSAGFGGCGSGPAALVDNGGADAGDVAAVAVSPLACSETTTWPNDTNSGVARVSYARKSWDASLRILVAEYATSSDFAKVNTLKWRYGQEGRVLTYLGVEQPFQDDYRYDENGNVVDSHSSYPALPDLMIPSTASVWMGSSFQNEYDASGRLASSTVTDYGPGSPASQNHRVFHEDAAGRCDRIDTTGTSGTRQEIRSYDDNGRVSRVEVTAAGSGYACVHSVQTSTYDDQGRVLLFSLSCTETTTSNGRGLQTNTHSYRADGSERIDFYDGVTDILGQSQSIVERSPGCGVIDAAIGSPPDNRCRVP